MKFQIIEKKEPPPLVQGQIVTYHEQPKAKPNDLALIGGLIDLALTRLDIPKGTNVIEVWTLLKELDIITQTNASLWTNLNMPDDRFQQNTTLNIPSFTFS